MKLRNPLSPNMWNCCRSKTIF